MGGCALLYTRIRLLRSPVLGEAAAQRCQIIQQSVYVRVSFHTPVISVGVIPFSLKRLLQFRCFSC